MLLRATLVANLRVRIPHAGQIRGPRARIQIVQQAVIARLRLEFRNAAVWIVDVAEHDRLGGARALANLYDLSVDLTLDTHLSYTLYFGLAQGKAVIRTVYPRGASGHLAFGELNYRF